MLLPRCISTVIDQSYQSHYNRSSFINAKFSTCPFGNDEVGMGINPEFVLSICIKSLMLDFYRMGSHFMRMKRRSYS